MGRYIQRNLIKNETVLFEAHYHWTVWALPVICTAASVVLSAVLWFKADTIGLWPFYLSLVLLASALALLARWYFKWGFDEFAVTDQRIFIKKGIFARETIEHNLKKVEAVSVEQSILERIINRGTLTFSGTGSTCTSLGLLASPHSFRKAIQGAMDNYDRLAPAASAPDSSAGPALSRVEQIERLKRLLDEGALTEAEYEREKMRVLAS